MNTDIIFVTYNSEKWIEQCLDSIVSSNIDLNQLSLFFTDNNSTDQTLPLLNSFKKNFENKFRKIDVIKNNKNKGFGQGNNLGVKQGSGDYLFFLNIDTEINTTTFQKIFEAIELSPPKVKMWELKQLPYEHPKYYDPVTKLTSWGSGACLIVERKIFEEVGGFDENIFMYDEDVDLSWKIRSKGYTIQYLNHVPIMHYSYEAKDSFKKVQYIGSTINNLYLRYKYGHFGNIVKGYLMAFNRIIRGDLKGKVQKKESFKIRIEILKKLFTTQPKYIKAGIENIKCDNKKNHFSPSFYGYNYEINRLDNYPVKQLLCEDEMPLVSIIVRTCNRPQVLKETLDSICQQSYTNIEVVVVEDGENKAENQIKAYSEKLNIKYIPLGKSYGRCHAGNIGLQNASGTYFNFLDDDDLFYDDHVETLVNAIHGTTYKVAYSVGFETPIRIVSKDPYIYDTMSIIHRYKEPFDLLHLFRQNITPIQCVMFHRNLYDFCGGFDEGIDALEDWDLWIRYALESEFLYVEKTTSIYRVPYEKEIYKNRSKDLSKPLEYLREKHKNVNINGESPISGGSGSADKQTYRRCIDWLSDHHMAFFMKALSRFKQRLKRYFK